MRQKISSAAQTLSHWKSTRTLVTGNLHDVPNGLTGSKQIDLCHTSGCVSEGTPPSQEVAS